MMRSIILSLAILFSVCAYSQNSNVPSYGSTSVSGCSGNIYDPGGPSGNYPTDCNGTILLENVAGLPFNFVLSNFATESGADGLIVYDGANTSAPILIQRSGTYSGSTSFTSSSSQVLIYFYADYSIQNTGFKLAYSTSAGSGTVSANFDFPSGSLPMNWPIPFTNLSSANAGSKWNFGDGEVSSERDPAHVFSSSGTFPVKLVASNCTYSDSITKSVTIAQAPIISATPSSINTLIQGCNDSAIVQVKIKNTGYGPLAFDATKSDLTEDMENGQNSAFWSYISGGQIDISCPEGENYTQALYFNSYYQRYAQTVGLDLSQTDSIQFDLYLGGSNYGCEKVDQGYEVHLSYSTDGGFNYEEINLYYNEGDLKFKTISEALPIAARTSNTILMWQQPYFYSSYYDTWGLDNIRLFQGAGVVLSPNSGTVEAADSTIVNVKIYSAGLTAGTYSSTITLKNNQPGNENYNIPVNFTITGNVDLSSNKPCINFGNVQQNETVTDTIIVSNIGCADAYISSSITNTGNFSDSFTSGMIDAFKNDTVVVSFTPSSVGAFTDTLYFNNSQEVLKVCLTGTGTPSPSMTVNPDSLSVTINSCNDSVLVPVKIYNKGLGNLEYSIDSNMYNGNLKVLLIDVDYSSSATYYSNIKSLITNSIPEATLTETSDKNNATLLPLLRKNDIVIIPRNYNYNAYSYGSSTQPAYETYLQNGGKALVCGEVDYLSGSYFYGSVYSYYTYSGDKLYAASPVSPLLNGVSFPMTLSTSGHRMIQSYDTEVKNLITYSTTYGGLCERNEGVNGKLYYLGHDFSYTNTDFNRLFTNVVKSSKSLNKWITLSSYKGTVLPGDSATIMVKVKSSGLNSGVYNTTVEINTNDPLNKKYSLPVHFVVDGEPEITYNTACIDFGSVMEKTKNSVQKEITNTGCDTLRITGFVPGNSAYSVSPSSLAIAPGEKDTITVTFFPQSTGTYNYNITVNNNDRDTVICVTGTATPAPVISANPSSLTVNLGSCFGDSALVTFSLNNTGLVNLNWTAQNSLKLRDEFTTTYNSTIWQNVGGGLVSTYCDSYSGNGLQYYQLDRTAQTKPFVISGGSLEFYYKQAGCDQPEYGDEVKAAYSLDGVNWVDFFTFDPNMYLTFTKMNLPIPSGANGATTRFKIYQPSFTDQYYDTWTIDNFEIVTISNNNNVDPTSGTIAPSGSNDLNAYIKNQGLSGGTYSDTLYFTTNDPTNPIFKIPVTKIISTMPCANFGSQIGNCNGIVSFSDSTVNPGSTYKWDFGDGATSTLRNPSHTYANAGTYSVKLISCNNSGCDTIVKQVNLVSVSGPKTACTPATSYSCCGYGITKVTFGTINNTSGDALLGYQDFSCTQATQVYTSQAYMLAVKTGGYEDVYAWIDFNNDGTFSTGERYTLTRVDYYNLNLSISIPASAVKGTPLRMRLESYQSGYYNPEPCATIQYGQHEDYTVIVEDYQATPDAQFTSASANVCDGKVTFTDKSVNVPTLWLWDFGDGQYATTQNPTHQYATSGTYSVLLKATNSFGTDSIRKSVTVVAFSPVINTTGAPKLNSPINFSATGGTILAYDWNFGDGGTSTIATPSHTFTTVGLYEVKLTATSDIGCVRTVSKWLDISVTSINEIDVISNYSVFPNPATDFVTIKSDASAGIQLVSILDLNGKLISEIDGNMTNTQQLDVSGLAAGNYLLRIVSANGTASTQFNKK